MQHSLINANVRLMQDIPELGLRTGETGVVCSTWFEPTPAYEVEFKIAGLLHATRTLLLEHQIQVHAELGKSPSKIIEAEWKEPERQTTFADRLSPEPSN